MRLRRESKGLYEPVHSDRRAGTRAVALSLVGVMIIPASAAAQSPDLDALTARCEALDDSGDKATCLYVVGRFLDPDAPATSPPAYGADLPSPGVVQVGPSANIALVSVDWDAKPAFSEPATGNRFVAIEVLYEATVDGASYNPFDWSMVDFDGFNYDRSFSGKEPDLGSSDGALPLGRKARGWVTFEVPMEVGSFEVVANGGDTFSPAYLRWRIDE